LVDIEQIFIIKKANINGEIMNFRDEEADIMGRNRNVKPIHLA